ncbi:hypothetical protein D3C75_1103120 [compost metagenome]
MLALVVVAGLACRQGDVYVLTLAGVAALALLTRQRRRYERGLAMLLAERGQPAPWGVLALGSVVWLMALAGLCRLAKGG